MKPSQTLEADDTPSLEEAARPRWPTPGILARRTLLALGLWWVVSEGQIEALPVGLVAVAAAVALGVFLLPRIHYVPRPFALLSFVAWFILNSLRAGVVVGGSILFARPAVDPELLRLRLRLPPGGPRWLLADVVGMMPGTLCVALDDDLLSLHCLNGGEGVAEEVRELEQRIAHMLGLRLEAQA